MASTAQTGVRMELLAMRLPLVDGSVSKYNTLTALNMGKTECTLVRSTHSEVAGAMGTYQIRSCGITDQSAVGTGADMMSG